MLRKLVLVILSVVCVNYAFIAPTVPYRWVTVKDTITPTKLNKNNDTIYTYFKNFTDTVKFKYSRWVNFKNHDSTFAWMNIDTIPSADTINVKNITSTKSISGSYNGPLSGNVTGNIVGNVTGNLTGNVTGTADSAKGAHHLNGGSVSATTITSSSTTNLDSLHVTKGATIGGNVAIGTTSLLNTPLIVQANSGTFGISTRVKSGATGYAFNTFNSADGTEELANIGCYRSGANLGSLIFSTNNGATTQNRMTILPDGSIGINTTAPTQYLDVHGVIKSKRDNGGSGAAILLTNENNGSVTIANTGVSSRELLLSLDDTAMVIDHNGNTGIKKAPSASLDVKGLIKGDSALINTKLSFGSTYYYNVTKRGFYSNTIDGSDTLSITIAAGGDTGSQQTRGAYLALNGNEKSTTPSKYTLSAGHITPGVYSNGYFFQDTAWFFNAIKTQGGIRGASFTTTGLTSGNTATFTGAVNVDSLYSTKQIKAAGINSSGDVSGTTATFTSTTNLDSLHVTKGATFGNGIEASSLKYNSYDSVFITFSSHSATLTYGSSFTKSMVVFAYDTNTVTPADTVRLSGTVPNGFILKLVASDKVGCAGAKAPALKYKASFGDSIVIYTLGKCVSTIPTLTGYNGGWSF